MTKNMTKAYRVRRPTTAQNIQARIRAHVLDALKSGVPNIVIASVSVRGNAATVLGYLGKRTNVFTLRIGDITSVVREEEQSLSSSA